jgi:hypothetical protein
MTATPDCSVAFARTAEELLQVSSTASNHRGLQTRSTKVHGESRARRGLNPTAFIGYNPEILTLARLPGVGSLARQCKHKMSDPRNRFTAAQLDDGEESCNCKEAVRILSNSSIQTC